MTGEANRRTAIRATIAAFAGAVVGVAIYLAASRATLRLGFPLDDAWIHQTYARNLAWNGEWAFIPGMGSGGSTSPLWTVLLAVGARFGVDPRAWAYLLGTLSLAIAASFAARWFRARSGAPGRWVVWLALLFALEWHLLWAAASGMEVILLVALSIVVMALSEPPVRRPLLVGALVGLGIWIRPDAVTLGVVPFLAILLTAGTSPRSRLIALAKLAAGAALLAVPYLLFNLRTAGTMWPSTFYAKQAEYGELRRMPFLTRFAQVVTSPLVGAGLLLLPGLILVSIVDIRRKRWATLGPVLWAVLYLTMFATLLPVTYQHGRYQIPVIGVLVVLGWEGISRAVTQAASARGRVALRTWGAATVVVGLGFALLGARAYALDVALIETEMVDTARWIADHTDARARIAAHDIGALGYFGGREVLDLAGLTQPEVVPILRDEAALASFLTAAGADYLMTFPGWYPWLTACAEPVYTSHGLFSPGQGGENMQVFRWLKPTVVPPAGCMLYSPRPDGTFSAADE